MVSPVGNRATPIAASMAIDRPETIDAAASGVPTRLAAWGGFTPAAQRRMAAGGFLAARGMALPGVPAGCPWGGRARGRKLPAAIAAQAIEASAGLRPDLAIRGRVGVARPDRPARHPAALGGNTARRFGSGANAEHNGAAGRRGERRGPELPGRGPRRGREDGSSVAARFSATARANADLLVHPRRTTEPTPNLVSPRAAEPTRRPPAHDRALAACGDSPSYLRTVDLGRARRSCCRTGFRGRRMDGRRLRPDHEGCRFDAGDARGRWRLRATLAVVEQRDAERLGLVGEVVGDAGAGKHHDPDR